MLTMRGSERLGIPAMQAVDESVRFVEFSPQLGLLTAIVNCTAHRRAVTATFRLFELLGDLGELFVQRSQQ
jgi:hypothetical protein